MGDYPVCAWRVGRAHDGRVIRRIVVRTTSYRTMQQWLARTTATRRLPRHTLWLDEETRPATVLALRTR